jgi:hypothetical protein
VTVIPRAVVRGEIWRKERRWMREDEQVYKQMDISKIYS